MEDRQLTIRIGMNAYLHFDEVTTMLVLSYLQCDPLVTDAVVRPHGALHLNAQNVR